MDVIFGSTAKQDNAITVNKAVTTSFIILMKKPTVLTLTNYTNYDHTQIVIVTAK